MPLKKLKLQCFTVFDQLEMDFSDGVNIFIGENGTGKTHIMKVLYAACQASRKDVSFARKLVGVFRPDGSDITRLVKRAKNGVTALAEVEASQSRLVKS
jgi:recombinational DNA repair ATPase RecF